jgi:hypothetical protein
MKSIKFWRLSILWQQSSGMWYRVVRWKVNNTAEKPALFIFGSSALARRFFQNAGNHIPIYMESHCRTPQNYVFENVQTDSGAHPVSHSMGTGDSFPGVKRPRMTTHLHLVSRLRMSGAIPQFHLHKFMACIWSTLRDFLKQKYNMTVAATCEIIISNVLQTKVHHTKSDHLRSASCTYVCAG